MAGLMLLGGGLARADISRGRTLQLARLLIGAVALAALSCALERRHFLGSTPEFSSPLETLASHPQARRKPWMTELSIFLGPPSDRRQCTIMLNKDTVRKQVHTRREVDTSLPLLPLPLWRLPAFVALFPLPLALFPLLLPDSLFGWLLPWHCFVALSPLPLCPLPLFTCTLHVTNAHVKANPACVRASKGF
jgi:hypothetical protein